MGLSIFISYAHSDKAIAREIASRLQARNVRVWIDEGELRVGDSLIQRISDALDEVHFVVALVSPYSVKSAWCQKEISLAMTGGLRRRGVKVLPLRVGDVQMPASLSDMLYLDVDPAYPAGCVDRLVRDALRHQEEHDRARVIASEISPDYPAHNPPPPASSSSRESATPSQGTVFVRHGGTYLGTVKWFDSDKGHGYIVADGDGDVFVMQSGIVTVSGRLKEGQRVVFTFESGGFARGRASNVRLVET